MGGLIRAPAEQMDKTMNHGMHTIVLGLMGVLLLGGCASQQMRPDPAYAPTYPVPVQKPKVVTGAIYQANDTVSLFADYKAHRVGDILTIVLEEKTDASKAAKTSTAKDDTVNLPIPSIAGGGVSIGGRSVFSADATANRSFKGQGASTQSNSLSGDVAVTVAKVLSNGNLVVRGEKLVSLNQGNEYLRISGIVRPADISTNNSVISTQVADARISYGGSGAVADANSMGWLGRFFQSVFWPF